MSQRHSDHGDCASSGICILSVAPAKAVSVCFVESGEAPTDTHQSSKRANPNLANGKFSPVEEGLRATFGELLDPVELRPVSVFIHLITISVVLFALICSELTCDQSDAEKSHTERQQLNRRRQSIGVTRRSFILQCFDRYGNPCNSGSGSCLYWNCRLRQPLNVTSVDLPQETISIYLSNPVLKQRLSKTKSRTQKFRFLISTMGGSSALSPSIIVLTGVFSSYKWCVSFP